MPELVREYGGCSVEFDTEGGFDVGRIPSNPNPTPAPDPTPASGPTPAPTTSAPSPCACPSSGPAPGQIGVATRRVVGKAPGGKRGKEKPKPKGAGPPLGAKAGLTGFGAPAAEPRVKKEFAKKVKRTPEEKAAAEQAAEQEKQEAAAVLARAAEQVEAEQALKRAAADRAAAERAAAEDAMNAMRRRYEREYASAAHNLSSHSSAPSPSPHDRGGKLQPKLQADRQTGRQAHRVMVEKTEKRAAKAAGEHSKSLHGKRATHKGTREVA